MTKETVVSFVLAVCVVGGSMFGFAKLGGLGGLPQARAATQAASPTPAVTAAAGPQQAQTTQTEAQQAQVDEAEDEAAPPVTGRPRCKAISHQITGIDGALASPLSVPVRDFYVKQRKSLQDEQAGLDC